MIRLIFCTIGAFIFGVIYGEILNALKFFDIKVNAYFFGGTISLAFLVLDSLFNHFKKKASLSNHDQILFNRIENFYFILFSIIGLILVIAIPFVWWGVIKKLAMVANQGTGV